MTLSRWLRDYLYIPLGGNRKGKVMTYRNLMLTMLIGGLWHGAGWTFVVWGGIHGVGARRRALAEGAGRATSSRRTHARRRIISRLITFNIVCVAWVFFRADSFATACRHAHRPLHRLGRAVAARHRGRAARDRRRDRLAVPPGADPVRDHGSVRAPARRRPGRCARVRLMLTNALGPEGVAPFIYFRF